MEPIPFPLRGDHITLGQLVKATGRIGTGAEVRDYLAQFPPQVNGDVETRRGRKLFEGDAVRFDDGETVRITPGP